MAIIKYGDYSYDTDTLPPATIHALLSSGITHKHGSEVSSAVISRIRREHSPKDAAGKVTTPLTKEEVKAWKEANPDTHALWTKEAGDEIYADALAGELGVRAPGAPRDPLGAEVDRLAKAMVDERVAALMSKTGQSLPKGWKKREDGPAITFADGNSFTYLALVDRAKAKHAEAFEAKARKTLDAKAKALAKAKESVGEVGSAEDLGF